MLSRMLPAMMGVLLSFLTVAHADLLNVGDEFPNWSLVDQNGNAVTSVSYTGRRYVMWFFPEAMTPGCTAEGRSFRDAYSQFETAGIAVLGVSFDVPQTNGVFASNESFPFLLLSDSNRELATRVGAAEETEQQRPERISYLVGEDGRIVKVYTNVQPVRHAQEILLDAGVATP